MVLHYGADRARANNLQIISNLGGGRCDRRVCLGHGAKIGRAASEADNEGCDMSFATRTIMLGAACAALFAGSVSAQTFGKVAFQPPSSTANAVLALAPKVAIEGVTMRRLSDKGVLQLEFSVVNRSDLAVTLRDLGMADNFALTNLRLVDFANKRRYAMGVADGICLCTTFGSVDGGLVKPGEAKTFWAWFALPPSDVREMSVLVPDRAPILNVQLQ